MTRKKRAAPPSAMEKGGRENQLGEHSTGVREGEEGVEHLLESEDEEIDDPPLLVPFGQFHTLQVEKVPFLVDDLIPHEGIVVVAGPPGSGKTTFLSQLAFHVAAGEPFYGHEVVTPGKVAYFAADDPRNVWKGLWGASVPFRPDVDLSHPKDETRRKLLIGTEGFTQWDAALLDRIRRGARGCRMVVLDTLADFLEGSDKDDAGVGALLRLLKRLARELEACIVIVHHAPWKGDREKGSVALRGAADAVYFLKEAGGGSAIRILKSLKRRWGEARHHFNMELVPAAAANEGHLASLVRFEQVGELSGKADKALFDERLLDEFVRVCPEDGHGQSDLARKLGSNRQAVDRGLKRLKKRGVAEDREVPGHNTKRWFPKDSCP